MSDVENKVEQSQEQNAPIGPTISIQDLQNAVRVIDYACDQGAFKGWQVIDQVIGVRSKIVAFLDAAAPKEEEKPAKKPSAKKPASKKSSAKK